MYIKHVHTAESKLQSSFQQRKRETFFTFLMKIPKSSKNKDQLGTKYSSRYKSLPSAVETRSFYLGFLGSATETVNWSRRRWLVRCSGFAAKQFYLTSTNNELFGASIKPTSPEQSPDDVQQVRFYCIRMFSKTCPERRS